MLQTVKEYLKSPQKNELIEIWQDGELIFSGDKSKAVEFYGDYILKDAVFQTDNEKFVLTIGDEVAAVDLKDTIDDMISDNYKKRFEAEYIQTKIRYEKLITLLDKIKAGELKEHNPYAYVGFNIDSPVELLERQAEAMRDYLNVLRIRAVIEGIKI